MALNDLKHLKSPVPTLVSRLHRPLDRAYVFLSFLLLFALAAIVFVTVIQASPATTQFAVGWYLSSGAAGTAFQRLRSDSAAFDGPDQIGFERKLFGLINEERVKRGLAPLGQNVALTRSARGHSSDMVKSQRLDVVDSTGRTPSQRADDAGFRPPQFVVEAVGAGFVSPEQVFESWLANPNTASDLLNSDANEVGVGYAYSREDNSYHNYWTADIGKRMGLSFTVVVNNGAEATTSSQVMLYIGGKGWADEMMISNSPDFANAEWGPFSETRTWILSDGTGPKQVHVKLRGQGGQIVETLGAIALNPAAKGVKPGEQHNDSMDAPRTPIVRAPAGEVPLNGTTPPGGYKSVSISTSTALAPGYYQTSEFMFGKVAVGIVMPQCNGAVDKCSETWTAKMMDQVADQVAMGTNWWVRKLNGQVSFVFDQQRQVPTGYEPINHSQSDEGLWLGDTMTRLGFTGSTYFEQVYAYNNWMRQKYGTDWAFTIFVANSEKSSSGTFSNGYFAYSYVPGPFTVTTYDNDGYTINNMASVIAHETGHIFGALDQYSGAKVACAATSGYLVFQNQNSQQNCSSNVDSIMRGGVVPYANNLIDDYALGMIGGRVSIPGGLPDPINTTPIVAINPIPSPSTKRNPTISGTAQDQPFPAPSGNSVTINIITNVKYRVDGGDWQNATPSDGSPTFNKVSQGFTFAPLLQPGTHAIEVQAFNRVSHGSGIVKTSVTVSDANTAKPIAMEATRPAPTDQPTADAPIPSLPVSARDGRLTLRIKSGNTAISLPVEGYTALSLAMAVNQAGGKVTEVDNWTGRNWQAYIVGANGSDFKIAPGVGYLIKAQAPSEWTVPMNPVSAPQVKIDKGWDMLAVPVCDDGSISCFTASSLAQTLNTLGGGIVEINRWVNGSWSAYEVGFPFNDFPIYVGEGYFVRTDKGTNWKP